MVTKLKSPIIVHGEESKESLGLTHIITGDGKGKTTSALGLALRAVGTGYNVYMIQFLKSGWTGELNGAKHLPNFIMEQYGVDAVKERQKAQTSLGEFAKDTTGRFVFQPDLEEKDAAKLALEHAIEVIASGKYDLVILDEINCVLDKKLIPIEEVIELIRNKGKVELVLTGRDAPKELYEYADYVSELHLVKNPWQKGIKARRGIEY